MRCVGGCGCEVLAVSKKNKNPTLRMWGKTQSKWIFQSEPDYCENTVGEPDYCENTVKVSAPGLF